MSQEPNHPRVGIGVIIVNDEGKILIGKRQGSHVPYYSIPGGHLDLGETFEAATIRETKEETNLDISNPKIIAVTNNLETYRESGKHYISIAVLAKNFSGELKIMEPDKCEGWQWADPQNIPLPQFDASRQAVECYLAGEFYKK
jgi:ADP-ribose pyrophosphatase YjhB (NUDIX family)